MHTNLTPCDELATPLGQGMVLRRPVPGDEKALALATHDRSDADRIWDDVWPMSEPQALELIEAQSELDWPDGQPCVRHWLIHGDQPGIVAGMLSMHWPAPGSPRVRIGHWVRASARGQGLGTRAVLAAVQWLRAGWPRAVVQMNISDANEPSRRLAQRCGFTLERRCAGVERHALALSPSRADGGVA